MTVFHDKVLIEETKGLLGGGSGQPDYEGVEIFQNLPPEMVDRSVALIGNDKIESLDGNLRVVNYLLGGFTGWDFKEGIFLQLRIIFLLAFEH